MTKKEAKREKIKKEKTKERRVLDVSKSKSKEK